MAEVDDTPEQVNFRAEVKHSENYLFFGLESNMRRFIYSQSNGCCRLRLTYKKSLVSVDLIVSIVNSARANKFTLRKSTGPPAGGTRYQYFEPVIIAVTYNIYHLRIT